MTLKQLHTLLPKTVGYYCIHMSLTLGSITVYSLRPGFGKVQSTWLIYHQSECGNAEAEAILTDATQDL